MEMKFISNSINICQHDSLNYSNIIKKVNLNQNTYKSTHSLIY